VADLKSTERCARAKLYLNNNKQYSKV